MANVNLKTDFRDGEKLFDYQLNNNFKAIMAALNAMNKIVWQDDQEVPDSILAFRGTTEELMNREIIDGQLLYDVNTGETYIDYEGKRISTGSGNAIHIGEEEPTNPSTQLWIPNDNFVGVGTEVVDSLEGNETNKAPSVYAVKNIINSIRKHDIITDGTPVKCGYKIDGRDVYVKLVDCGYLNAGVSKVAHNISNIDKMYSYDGFLRNENNGTVFAIPNISLNTSNAEVHVDIDKTNINIEAGTAFNGTLFKAYIYVYFTYKD